VLSPGKELNHRRPVWEALSSLFLDTDTSLARPWRVRLLAASPYTLDELDQILTEEVYPVCRWNLLSVAGEWAGFDLDWLEGRILRRSRSPLRWLRRHNVAKVTQYLSPEWQATRAEIHASRRQGGTSAA
jgi:hypothetical protein